MSEGDGVARTFKFLRNGEFKPVDMDWNKGIETARQTISEAMNAKNVAFLLGAGCSSLMKDGKEVGIPTMAPLAKEFCGETLAAVAAGFNAAQSASAEDQSGEDVEDLAGSQEYWVRGADGAAVLIKPEIAEDADPQRAFHRNVHHRMLPRSRRRFTGREVSAGRFAASKISDRRP